MSKRPEFDPNAPAPITPGTVQTFSAPYIDPRVMDPRVSGYQKKLAASQHNMPLGEIPLPPIPRLDQQFDPSRPMTMAEAAQRQRAGEFVEDNTDGGIFQRPQAMPKLLPAGKPLLAPD